MATCLIPVPDRQAVRESVRMREVRRRFGITEHTDDNPLCTLPEEISLDVEAGQICAIVGASGSGKTSLLNAIQHHETNTLMLEPDRFPACCAVIDGVRATESLGDVMGVLGACGLGEPALWLRDFDSLSHGQRVRASLARAMGQILQAGGKTLLLIDEFGSGLHRRCLAAMAHALRSFVTRKRLRLVVTLHDDDILSSLQPDLLIRTGQAFELSRQTVQQVGLSHRMNLQIVPGRKRDYASFAPMHYRGSESLGVVDKVFLLREPGVRGEALGIVVYSYPPLELALRNEATDDRFRGNAALLNRHMRILQRLVIHPDVRGCGLGQYLVSQTLDRAGTKYVECLSAMGSASRVFEEAGMVRIGQCAIPARQRSGLAKLEQLQISPDQADFEQLVCSRNDVRKIVHDFIVRWYSSRTSRAKKRMDRLTPETMAKVFRSIVHSRPVYYLWGRGETLKR